MNTINLLFKKMDCFGNADKKEVDSRSETVCDWDQTHLARVSPCGFS